MLELIVVVSTLGIEFLDTLFVRAMDSQVATPKSRLSELRPRKTPHNKRMAAFVVFYLERSELKLIQPRNMSYMQISFATFSLERSALKLV
jgi:hypothetical protein